MTIIDKVCGKMGLMDPIDEKMDFEEEELRSKTSGQEEPEMDA